jgi:hypothetical protein
VAIGVRLDDGNDRRGERGARPAVRFNLVSWCRYELMALKLEARADRSTRAVVQRITR